MALLLIHFNKCKGLQFIIATAISISIFKGTTLAKHFQVSLYPKQKISDSTDLSSIPFHQGCADPGKSYGSGSETDPTNFKKMLWDLIKSKCFQWQILQ